MNRLYENMTEKTQTRLKVQYEMSLALLNVYRSIVSHDNSSIPADWTSKSTIYRQMGNMIFDIRNSVLETNLYSEKLIDLINKKLKSKELFSKLKSKHAKIEHFYGRSSAAEKFFLEYYIKDPTFNEFCNFVISYGSYHRTTGDENQKVKIAFLKGVKNWIDAYDQVEVKLFEIKLLQDGNKVVRVDKVREVKKEELADSF